MIAEIREATHALAHKLKVVGLMNIQFAIKKDDNQLYVLEVNGGWTRSHQVVPGAKVRFDHVQ